MIKIPGSAITNIGKVDFLAVLPSGFFVFLVLFVSFSPDILVTGADKSFVQVLIPLSAAIQKNPPLLLFILFASYILGSLFRALSVNIAPVRLAGVGSSQRFPYRENLIKAIEVLKDFKDLSAIDTNKLPVIEPDIPIDKLHIIFNFWKDRLCVHAPEAYSLCQSYEARSRFFAGMFWASIVGMIAGLVIAARFLFCLSQYVHEAAIQLTIISTLMMFLFGRQLNGVRRQEADVVLFLYISYFIGNGPSPPTVEDKGS